MNYFPIVFSFHFDYCFVEKILEEKKLTEKVFKHRVKGIKIERKEYLKHKKIKEEVVKATDLYLRNMNFLFDFFVLYICLLFGGR